MVAYFDLLLTYEEAKIHCGVHNSSLLELWDEQEYNEVTNLYIFLVTSIIFHLFTIFRQLTGLKLPTTRTPNLISTLALLGLMTHSPGNLAKTCQPMLRTTGFLVSLITGEETRIVFESREKR